MKTATFNYKENANYDFAGNNYQDDTYQVDTYMPGIYRVLNTEGSPYYMVIGEYLSAPQVKRYVENAYKHQTPADEEKYGVSDFEVTGLEHMGDRSTIDNFDDVAEGLIAMPFNRKLFDGPQCLDDWMKFHEARRSQV